MLIETPSSEQVSDTQSVNQLNQQKAPLKGVGMGYRDKHARFIQQTSPQMDWFELLIENYLSDNVDLRAIDKLRSSYDLSFHCVGMSIGSLTPFDLKFLGRIRELEERWQPHLISDHFAWSHTGNSHFHELFPIPFTEESVVHFAERIDFLQNFFKRQILVENTSTYLIVPDNEMPEWEFINQVSQRSGCALLLDINNVYVNAFNHGFSADQFLNNINLDVVKEVHLGGYEDMGEYYFDSHSRPVSDKVWQGYLETMRKIPDVPTLIEWDNDIPDFQVVKNETLKARQLILEIKNETQTSSI